MRPHRARDRMVDDQLRTRGIRDPRILEAMGSVPREAFVPSALKTSAYDDRALEIGHGQTISQPYIVALMTSLLAPLPGTRILEVGGGSGYAAAIYATLGLEVWSLERDEHLAREASRRLVALGFHNIELRVADGSLGYEPAAPYDSIAVAAAAPHVPEALTRQLAPGGQLVLPVGDRNRQRLIRITKGADGEISEESISSVRFVPLVGRDAWPD